ncbi:MAG TPA: oligosaccharide flippase family protein [Actinomycetota bacterium]|nr:oligosaccharide flippase family protein [Actinomycetota bacterium]
MSDRPERTAKSGLAPESASDVRTVARGGAVQILGQVSQRSLTFLFTVVAARVLGTAGYGLYRQVSQVLAVAGQLGLAGFNYAAMRWIARARAADDHGGVLGAARVGLAGAGAASALVCALLLALAGALARGFADCPAGGGCGEARSAFAELVRVGAAYVPLFALLQVLRYCTQGYKTMLPSVIAGNVVQPTVRLGLGVAAFALGWGVEGAVATLTASVVVALVVAAWWFNRMLTPAQRAAPPRAPAAAMVRFALPQGGSSLLGVQVLGIGILVLGALADDQSVGRFAIALSLQGPGTVFLGGIVNIWAPVVADLHERGDLRRLESLYQTINRWIATFSFPVFAVLIVEPDPFVAMFDAPGAAPVVAALAVGNLFYTGTGPTGYVISMTGRPGVNLANSIVSVALYVALGIWAVPRYGVLGMAWVDAFVTALVNSARVVEAKLLVGVQPFGRTFYKPVVATLAGAAVLLAWRLLPGEGLALDVAGIAVAAAAYVGALALLGLDDEEREVLDALKRKVRRAR